jgi:purine-nucleoside phosphorylase
MNLSTRIHNAVAYIRSRISAEPTVGMILGSGLGDFADTLENRRVIPFTEIPDFPAATVPGHTGAFVFGTRNGQSVVCLQGRLHYYEGHPMDVLTMPVRIMAKLGVKILVLTNAAGGVNKDYRPGDLMLITDHINFSGSNPLIGIHEEDFGPRFPDVTDLYSANLRLKVKLAAVEAGIGLRQGVYMMFSGPSYETPAEIRMARILGADAVGMSTVPEAIVAAQCGIKVLGISCITNLAAGVSPNKLSHEEVMETAALAHDHFHSLLELILKTV